jgi:prepilin-type N-terminal cleavage/methylation domain-containing protein
MNRPRGFTLVELLIATTLMALLVVGALTAYAQATATFHSADIEQRLHERAQYVFATLEPDLQMAGYFGGGAPPAVQSAASIPASALACGAGLITRLDRAVDIDSAYTHLCPPQGRGAVSGAHIVTIRRVATQPSDAASGRLQWLNSLVLPAPGQLIWNGALPSGVTLDAPRTQLSNLVVRSYYVARAADGDPLTPALRVKSLTSIAGNPAFLDTEVMPGVEDLQVELLPSDAEPRSALVTLRVRADSADARTGEPLRRLSITRHFALRNAAPHQS